MSNFEKHNQHIAKNTLLLYVRMIVVLLVGLYSSRVILDSLGVIDYGIYNVVGGLVVLFSYLDSALSLAITRFYSYELPHGLKKVNVVFNTSVIIQIAFALIIVILLETFGLWLINHKMVLPENRLHVANLVYQCSIATTVISILSVPFNASITSHEKMSAYAIFSMIECFLKLFVALMMSYSPIDKLFYYGFGLFGISILIFILKYIYCKRQFEEIKFQKKFSNHLFRKMFSFVGWNFLGATAGISVSQGLNFIINLFFGPTINAARGIAFQIQGAINQLVTNINMAVNPQIIKRYSIGETDSMFRLVFFSSKVSFLLLCFVSLPILIDTSYVFGIWLKQIPENAILFTRLMLLYMLTVSLTYSVNMSAQASGNIKTIQIAESIVILLNIPCVVVLFHMGLPAYTSFLSMIFFSILALSVKLIVLRTTICFPSIRYFKDVILRISLVSIFCVLVYIFFSTIYVRTFFGFIIKSLSYLIPLSLFIWFVGFMQNERQIILRLVQKYLNK